MTYLRFINKLKVGWFSKKSKQDGQFSYQVTMRSLHVTNVAVEKQ